MLDLPKTFSIVAFLTEIARWLLEISIFDCEDTVKLPLLIGQFLEMLILGTSTRLWVMDGRVSCLQSFEGFIFWLAVDENLEISSAILINLFV